MIYRILETVISEVWFTAGLSHKQRQRSAIDPFRKKKKGGLRTLYASSLEHLEDLFKYTHTHTSYNT